MILIWLSLTSNPQRPRATITNGNWINPTYLPSTRSAQRIKLPEIIAAQDTEIESEYVIAGQVHRRERLIGHHSIMEIREEVTRHSHVGLNSLSLSIF